MNTTSRTGSRIVRPCSSGPTSRIATSTRVFCSMTVTRSPMGWDPRRCSSRKRSAHLLPSVSGFIGVIVLHAGRDGLVVEVVVELDEVQQLFAHAGQCGAVGGPRSAL